MLSHYFLTQAILPNYREIIVIKKINFLEISVLGFFELKKGFLPNVCLFNCTSACTHPSLEKNYPIELPQIRNTHIK